KPKCSGGTSDRPRPRPLRPHCPEDRGGGRGRSRKGPTIPADPTAQPLTMAPSGRSLAPGRSGPTTSCCVSGYQCKKALLYRLSRADGGLVSATPGRAAYVARIRDAISGSRTWAEFRRASPRTEYSWIIRARFDDTRARVGVQLSVITDDLASLR